MKASPVGNSSQVTVGAILQVNGVLGTNDILSVNRVVILTGFI